MAAKREVAAQPRYKLAESGELNQAHPETGYAPHITAGCNCQICPLGPNRAARLPELNVDAEGRQRRLWEPVKTHNEGKEVYLLGAMPATSEAESGLPMDGASGWRLNLGLVAAINALHADDPSFKKVVPDTVRRLVATGNVVACQGPGAPKGAFERMRATLQRENSRRKKQGLAVVPDPVDCCRPRLLAEIAGSQKIILLGTEALQAVLRGALEAGEEVGAHAPKKKGEEAPRESLVISNKRGAMGEVVVDTEACQARYREIGRVVPRLVPLRWAATFHPAATIYSPGKLPKFKADISKFFRFFEGKLKWIEPAVLMHPSLARIDAFFDAIEREAASSNIESPTCRIEVDTETTGKEALIAQMRCIGIGRSLSSQTPVEACVCEPHWNPRLDAQRVRWLGKDKRFRGGSCPICSRGNLDSDADIERSASIPQSFLDAAVGAEADSQAELDSPSPLLVTQEAWSEARQDDDLDLDSDLDPLASPWSEARAQDCAGSVEFEAPHLSAVSPRSSDYEVLLLLSPFAAPWLYAHLSKEESSRIWAYLAGRVERILADRRILKAGHNLGFYDRQVIEPSPWRGWNVVGSKEEGSSSIRWERGRREKAWIEATPEPVEDTLYATRFSCPDGEKGLGDVGPEKVDVSTWKTDHADNKVALSKNLWELGVYCGSDVCVNGRIYPILRQEAVDNGALLGYIPAVSSLLALPGETYRGTQPSSEAEIAAFVRGGRKMEYAPGTQISPYEVDHRTQFMSVGAHRVGLYVNQDRVRVFSEILHRQGQEHLCIFADIAKSKYGVEIKPKPADDRADSELTKKELRERRRREEKGAEDDDGDLNPNSANQMRDLFYMRMKIPRPEFLEEKEMLTKTGAPRVDDVVIRAFMADERNSREIKQALGHLRAGKRKEFKLATGFLDTLTRPLADPGQVWPGSPRGYLWPDGCIRAHMNTHSNVNWRLNISGPNFAQIGSRKGGILQEIGEGGTRLDELLRDSDESTRKFLVSEMFRLMKQEEKAGKQYLSGKLKSVLGAYPGYLLVGGDMDQLHLRIIANLYKIPILLNAFLAGEDPHTTLAEVLFGAKFTQDAAWAKVGGYSRKKKPPSGSGALILREVAKTFRYAVIYWAHPDTAWRVVVSAENEFGALVNAHYTKDEIRQFHAAWRVAEPEWDSFYWARMRRDHAAHQGRVQAPLSWRFSPFIADNDKSKIVNDPVLSTEADIARIAEVRLMQTFPFGGDSCVSPSSFGGLPGQLLGLLGKYDPGSVLREGLCIQVHDFMAAQIKDKSGSRGSIWIPKKNKEGEEVRVEVDRWQHETLMLAQEALTFKVPGQDVVYSCEPGLSAVLSEV